MNLSIFIFKCVRITHTTHTMQKNNVYALILKGFFVCKNTHTKRIQRIQRIQ